MVDRALGVKKSNFPASATIPSTATFDYVYNNTNVKILATDLLAGLGVTGTLVQAGDPTGTAILDVAGTVNSIRTVEDGPGILSSVSALNGLKLQHNFDQDPIGVPITANMTTATPDFASLLPGAGMSITKTDNEITFTATGVPLPATKAVAINTESDFPTAVTGVITLEDGVVYIISNDVTTANRFVLGANTSVVGYNLVGPTLTYTGSATMFTGVDVNAGFLNLHLACPTAKVFDISDSVGGTKLLGINNVLIDSCDTVGDFDDMLSVVINNIAVSSATSEGILFAGSNILVISIRDYGILSASATFTAIDFGTAVATTIDITTPFISGVSGAVGITGAASNGNLTATGFGKINGGTFSGALTPITTIDIGTDVQWSSFSNNVIPNTHPDTLSYNTAGTTVTIATINTPVLIGGTWVDDNSHHFTVDGAGVSTYIGVKDLHVPITAAISAHPATGTNKDYTVYVAINGSIIAPSGRVARASSGDRQSVTPIWQHVFQTGDTVSMMLENNTDTTNFTVDHAIMRVN